MQEPYRERDNLLTLKGNLCLKDSLGQYFDWLPKDIHLSRANQNIAQGCPWTDSRKSKTALTLLTIILTMWVNIPVCNYLFIISKIALEQCPIG